LQYIRPAQPGDAARIAEIEIFNYRLNFYPIFRDDAFYFSVLQVPALMKTCVDEEALLQTYVYDDGVVKGFVRVDGAQICKLYVEPVLQGRGIGERLLRFAVDERGAQYLWALEKNTRAIAFYERHGFTKTGEREPEEDTSEYLVQMAR